MGQAGDSYDVFFSYHSPDHGAVIAVAQALRRQGLKVFLDRWYLIPGRPWLQELERILASCRSVAAFVGPHGRGSWQQREISLALSRQDIPVIPVLLPGAEPTLEFLTQHTWVDLRHSLNDPFSLEILSKAVRGEEPGPDLTARVQATLAAVCPYRGLRPFREEDAPFFFGRETFIDRLTKAVSRQTLVALVGASGCGKSSVARAGLIPRLRRDEGDQVWEAVTFLPGDRPLHALAAALLPLLEPEKTEVERLVEVNKLAGYLGEGRLALRDVVARVLVKQPGTDRLLLVADQWEELYTLTREEARRRFLDEILQASQNSPLSVVLTLRGDFFGQAVSYRPLADRLQDAVVTLGPMTRQELTQAVEQPAEKVHLTFEPGLLERLLDDVGQEPGNLPLLEFALTNLWEHRHGGQLLHQVYEDMGRVQGALAQRAESAYQKLSSLEQQAATRVFLELVQTGEGTEDTRRRASFQEMEEGTGELVKKLADARLVVTGRDAATGQETVEVAHEALIRHWNRLQGWLNTDREFLLWRQRLRHDLADWQRTSQDEGALLRGTSLAEAERWLAGRAEHLIPGEREFIQASLDLWERERALREQERQSRQRQQRRWFLTLTAGLLAALVLMVVAGWQWQRADGQRRVAVSRQLATQALHLKESRLDLSLLLSVAATKVADTPEARSSLLAGVLYQPHLVSFLQGHRRSVAAVAFSPDGRFLASAGWDHTIRLWDVASHKPHGKALASDSRFHEPLAFSPDSKILASTGSEDTIRLWDVEDARPRGPLLTGHTGRVSSLVFSPDGRTLASASWEDGIMLWDLATGRVLGQLRLPPSTLHIDITSLAFSPDGKTLASPGYADQKPAVVFWDVERQRLLGSALEVHGVGTLAFSPDGRTLVLANGDAILWDVATRRKVGSLRDKIERQQGRVSMYFIDTLAFSADGTILAAAGNGALFYWDVARGELSRPPLKIPYGRPAFHPNLSILATPGTLELWDVNRERTISQVSHDLESRNQEGLPYSLWEAGFSRDGRILALKRGSYKAKAELWDASRRQFVASPWPEPGYFIGQDYDVLVVGDEAGAKTCWDISRNQLIGELPQEYDVEKAYAFSPDGHVFAYAMEDNSIRLWDVAQRQSLGPPLKGHSKKVHGLAFSPDGKTLASASTWEQLYLWDVRRQEPLGPPLSLKDHHGWALTWLAFSPNGKILATGSGDRIVLWDPVKRRLLGPLVGTSSHELRLMTFSPDGHMLAVTDVEASIALCDVAQRSPLLVTIEPRRGHKGEIKALAFSKDSDTLISVDSRGEIESYDMRVTSWQGIACQRANRNLTRAEWQQYLPDEPYRFTCPDLPAPEE